MPNIITAHSSQESISEVIQELKAQLDSIEPKAIVYFASSIFEPHKLSAEISGAFSQAQTFGCTTSGELVSGKMLKDSVVAMAFSDDIFEDVQVGIIENMKEENNVPVVFSQFEEKLGKSMLNLNHKEYVGLILTDGLSGSEEKIMEAIGDLTDITFIGGSAGDDLKFSQTNLYANGKAYTNAAVLALLKPSVEFEIVKTQSFEATDKVLTATKVNEANRQVLEFNNEPAVEAYAKAIGCSIEVAGEQFMSHPLGLMVGDEPYVRSPQQLDGSSMIFYCQVKEGMELKLLNARSMLGDTAQAISEEKLGSVQGIINFHCILRTLQLQKEENMEAYGQIFSKIPTVGFSTYGEQYIGHINQTSTMLVFK